MPLNTIVRPSGEKAMAVRLGRVDNMLPVSLSAGCTSRSTFVTERSTAGLEREVIYSVAPNAAIPMTATIDQGRASRHLRPRVRGDVDGISAAPASASSISKRASPTSRIRRRGSLSRHRWSKR